MLSYYIIDLETTGLAVNWHETTQISIIKCSNRNQLSKFIKPEHPERASEEALSATGRVYKDLFKGSSKKEVVEFCDSFIKSDGLTDEHRCFVAHNANFDQRFSYFLWKSLGKQFPCSLWMCTKSFAKSWANKLGIAKPKLTLTASLEFTGIKPFPGVHEAGADARNTYLLWKKGMDEGIDHLPHIKSYPHQNDNE